MDVASCALYLRLLGVLYKYMYMYGKLLQECVNVLPKPKVRVPFHTQVQFHTRVQ